MKKYSGKFNTITIAQTIRLMSAIVLINVSAACRKIVTEVEPQILDCSTINDNLVLSDRGGSPDYIIPCRVIVNARLTIEPGVEIAFSSDAGLEFRSAGSLDAQGNAAKPIIFRGEGTSPGYWRGIRFTDSNNSNKMYFVTVDGGGGLSWDGSNIKANISLSGSSRLEIKNSTISNSASDGIHLASLNSNPDALAGFDGNTFSGNGQYPLRVLGNHVKDLGFNSFTSNGINKIEVHRSSSSMGIASSQSWTYPGTIILINDRLDIGGGAVSGIGNLTIGEGIIIEMGADRSISVNSGAFLTINGTSSNPVEIRGENDMKDYWKGIYIGTNNPNNVFTYTQISGGGSSSHSGYVGRDCVRIGSSIQGPYSLTLNNGSISNSSYCGIRFSANPAIATFTNNNTTFFNLGEEMCNF